MEPIALDFIELTADFMMHLTKKQLDEYIEDLKKRQFNIYNIVEIGLNTSKDTSKRDYAFRMALIIIRVMESYKIKIPMISLISIKEIITLNSKKPKFEDNTISEEQKLQNALNEIGQPHYIEYLKNMVNTDKDYQTIFTKDESHNIFFIMTTIALVYSITLKRYS